jgi:DNA repair protein RadC
LLDLVLFRAISRRDVKPLAKAPLTRFGSFAEVVAARPERLKEIEGLSDAAIVELKIVAETAKRFAEVKLEKGPSMGSFSAVLDY